MDESSRNRAEPTRRGRFDPGPGYVYPASRGDGRRAPFGATRSDRARDAAGLGMAGPSHPDAAGDPGRGPRFGPTIGTRPAGAPPEGHSPYGAPPPWYPAGRDGRAQPAPREGAGGLVKLVGLLLSLTVVLGGLLASRNEATIRLLASGGQWDEVARFAGRSVASTIDEQPAFATVPGAPDLPLCASVSASDGRDLADAMNLMRRTDEGRRLFDQLLDELVCVGVEDIPYNSGYAYASQSSLTGDWSRSTIMVDSDILHAGESDVVAALLVHEATHIDRYINGLACDYDESCTVLANGVELEEEVAAHAAEAEWWIEAYGEDGKRFAIGYDYGLNRLADAYLEGRVAFESHVRELRGDTREGGF